ncbi:MAG: alkaline phytoceramidase [Chromatiales bacterium]|nr:alkaline phytoceramidase [Gammaproteobacteria bacterium]MBW6475621.1 alkaline phytoceramidase [Chromatiales bacterium]
MPLKKPHRLFLYAALLAIILALLGVFAWLPPIAQPQWYHDFSEHRTLSGVPHFFNVGSNLAFHLVALWGLWHLAGGRTQLQYRWEYTLWRGFFVLILLVGFGSGYYHLAPSNNSLFWDRLPIALAFAVLLVITLEERINTALTLPTLLLLLPYAAFGVLYWWWTEQTGNGDLRPYLLMQLLTLSLLPAITLLYQGRYQRRHDIAVTVSLYLLAVVCEWLDHEIHALTQFISGHTLKHLLIALSIAWLVRMLKRRKPILSTSSVRQYSQQDAG